MGDSSKSSLLTGTQRDLFEGEPVAHEGRLRRRAQERIQALLSTDAELVCDALEEGELNADTITDGFDLQELGDAISELVAALYLLGDAKDGFDPGAAIKTGVERGREGYLSYLERKVEREGINALTIAEMLELRDAKPEMYWERANLGMDQKMSDTHGGMGGIDEIVEDLTGGDE